MRIDGATAEALARTARHTGATLVLTLLLLSGVSAERAHAAGNEDGETLVLLVDTSGSMNDGGRLIDAQNALTSTVDGLDSDRTVSLREFSGSCDRSGADRELVRPGTTNREELRDAVAGLEASGGTPMTLALGVTLRKLQRLGGGDVILVTDGADSCDDDPCELARGADSQGVSVVVNTVGLGDEADAGTLRCIAESTGGVYAHADDQETLEAALDRTATDSSVTWLPLAFAGGTAVAAVWLLSRRLGTRRQRRLVSRTVHVAARAGYGLSVADPEDLPGSGPTLSVRLRPRPARWQHEERE